MHEDRTQNTDAGAADGGPGGSPGDAADGIGADPPPSADAAESVDSPDDLAGEPAAGDDARRVAEERDEYLESLRRLKAEFDNYRKRAERDRQAQAAGAERGLIASLLPVVDNLERAVDALDQALGDDVSTGVDMVRVQLGEVLAGRGLARIEADGAPFDPHFHEAVATVPAPEQPPGTILEVVQPGYMLGDTVIRPSSVVVSAAG